MILSRVVPEDRELSQIASGREPLGLNHHPAQFSLTRQQVHIGSGCSLQRSFTIQLRDGNSRHPIAVYDDNFHLHPSR